MGTIAKAVKSPFITEDEAAALVRRILPLSADAANDDAAKALITIVDRLASDDDLTTRDNNRETFFRAIFTNSAAFDDAQMAFIGSAGISEAV